MIDLSLVKQHLNIMDDFYDDDFYIAYLIDVAESTLQTECNINMANIDYKQFEIFKMAVC
jgi:hypothetical protein